MERIGRYTIVRRLGGGGQGEVFEATQVEPVRRRVALKVLWDGGEDVRREARLAAELRHPHLVDVFEVGRDGDRWFCAMELCEGGTLAGREALPPRAVVEVGLQVCSALSYAHRALELVHLDLKPANLLLQGGAVKVADLGIARARGFDGDQGIVRGTPRYMAPEQRTGRSVDARADVYALGKLLRELALGADVDDEATVAEGEEVEERATPPWLAPVVARCIAPDPGDRFAGMAELARALRGLEVGGDGLRQYSGAPEPPGAAPGAFVGREGLLAHIVEALVDGAVVTLKGAGGIGKSRLARAWADGAIAAEVTFVELAEARTSAGVVDRVARALGLPVAADSASRAAAVGEALAGRGACVLVLDGVEQLAGDLDVLETWRRRAPSLRVLATSRVPLGLQGETVVEIPPLDEDDAVTLMVARARERGVEVDDPSELGALARRLDGVPMALELAAGRLGVLSVAEVLERMGLSLLRSGALGLSPRQATVRGALDWSWELLGEAERATLAWLSVFRGGFARADVPRVVAHPLVDALLRHSLVSSDGRRLRLLAPVLDYAAQRLDERGERDEAERRHGAWFARLGAEDPWAPDAAGAVETETAWRRAIDAANLVAAAERAASRGDGDQSALATLGAVARLRETSDRAAMLGLLDRAMEAGTPSHLARLACVRADIRAVHGDLDGAEADLRVAEEAGARAARVQFTRGWIQLRRGQVSEAREGFRRAAAAEIGWRALGSLRLRRAIAERVGGAVDGAVEEAERALSEARRHGDTGFEARARLILGDVAKQRGQVVEALAHYTEGLAVAFGQHTHALSLRINVGRALWALDRIEEARAPLEASARGFRRRGMWATYGNARTALADLEMSEGRHRAARTHIDEVLALRRELGDEAMVGFALAQRARLEALTGDDEAACATLREALEVHEGVGNRILQAFDRAQLAAVLLRLGHVPEAVAQIEASFPEIGYSPATRGYALTVRGEARAAGGRSEVARADLDEGLALLRGTTEQTFLRAGLCCAARALADAALLEEARGDRSWTPGSSAAVELARTAAALDRSG